MIYIYNPSEPTLNEKGEVILPAGADIRIPNEGIELLAGETKGFARQDKADYLLNTFGFLKIQTDEKIIKKLQKLEEKVKKEEVGEKVVEEIKE